MLKKICDKYFFISILLSLIVIIFTFNNYGINPYVNYEDGKTFKGDTQYIFQPSHNLYKNYEEKYSKQTWLPFLREKQQERAQIISPSKFDEIFTSIYPYPSLRIGSVWVVKTLETLGFYKIFDPKFLNINPMIITNTFLFLVCSLLIHFLSNLYLNSKLGLLFNSLFITNICLNHTIFVHMGHFLLGLVLYLLTLILIYKKSLSRIFWSGFFLIFSLTSSSQSIFLAPLIIMAYFYKHKNPFQLKKIFAGLMGIIIIPTYIFLCDQSYFYQINDFTTFFQNYISYKEAVNGLLIYPDWDSLIILNPLITDNFYFLLLLPVFLACYRLKKLNYKMNLVNILIIGLGILFSLILIYNLYIPIPRASFGYTLILSLIMGLICYYDSKINYSKTLNIFIFCLFANFVLSSSFFVKNLVKFSYLGHPKANEVFHEDVLSKITEIVIVYYFCMLLV